MNHRHQPQGRAGLWSPSGLALLGFLAIAAFFLLTEHRAHFFGILPFLLLLACPLLHLFMHGRHGGHGGSSREHADPREHRHSREEDES